MNDSQTSQISSLVYATDIDVLAYDHKLERRDGYWRIEIERLAGLVAAAGQVHPHPRQNRAVEVRMLDPQPGRNEDLWAAVLQLQIAQLRSAEWAADLPDEHLSGFRSRRNSALRELFRAGRGAWYVALLDGEVVGSLGIVVTDGRARYQAVDTVASRRGQGIATRLVADAARLAAEQQPIDHYVMVADPEYHAITIYESVGFRRTESVCGVQLRPR